MNIANYYKDRKVLITGGGGFIGSNLAQKLVDLGSKVRIVDSKLSGHGFNIFNISSLQDRVELDFSDIRDFEAVRRNILHQDIVFNLAAQVGEKSSLANPELDRSINVGGHCNVLRAIIDENPSAHIVFSGSRLEYGKVDGPMPVSEERPLRPITPYAQNKVLGEKLYLDAHLQRRVSARVVRITNPYGPRASINNPGYCITNWFIGRALSGLSLPIYGDGAQLRDYLFIDDLVDALLVVGAKKEAEGQVFNIGSGVGTPFLNMAQEVLRLAPETSSKIEFIDWPKDAKEKETGDFVADIEKVRSVLEWEPKYSMQEGLRKTIDFYKKNMKYYT